MFKVPGTLRNCIFSYNQTFYSFRSDYFNKIQKHNFFIATNKLNKWDLISAVSLERKPVITKPLNEMENKFFNVLSEIEYERSFKSDHEFQKENDKIRAEQLKKGKLKDIDSEVVQQTAQDFEDAYKDELKAYKFSERFTNADAKNDIRSIHRKLDQNLLLVVNQKIGQKMYWVLPQGINKEGESMRQTAERILSECCGESLKTTFLGNAPCGFYKYKYPQGILKNGCSVGAKIFFFKAFYLEGSPILQKNSQISDYQWVSKDELPTILQKDYRKSISLFLVDNDD